MLKPTLSFLKRRWWMPVGILVIGGVTALSMQEQPLEAEVAIIGLGPVEQFLLEEGKTRLDQEYTLTLPVAGEIPRLKLEVGDWVKQGQVVLTLRRFDRTQQLAGLKAQVQEVTARQQGIVAQIPTPEEEQMAQGNIREAQNQLAQARQQASAQQLELQQRERTLERQQRLYAEQTISQAEYEETTKQVAVLRKQVQQAQLQIAQAQQGVSNAQLALAKLQRNRRDQQYLKGVYQAQAQQIASQIALKQDELQQGVLRAPISGPVLEVFTPQAGLQAAGTAVLKLGDPQSLSVEADFLSEEIPQVKTGMPAEISGKALGDKKVMGQVSRIYPSGFTKISALGVEQQRVKLLVRAPLPQIQVRPGTRVDVRVITAAKTKAVRIPERALFKQDGQWHVFKVNGTERAELQAVTLGLKNEDWAEITHGLQAGDRLITQLENALKPGALIRPKTTPKDK